VNLHVQRVPRVKPWFLGIVRGFENKTPYINHLFPENQHGILKKITKGFQRLHHHLAVWHLL